MTALDPTLAMPRTGLDLGWLLGIIGDDPEFLAELVALFEQDSTRLVDQVRQAADRLDGDTLARSAHALKGLLGHFGQSPALERCRRIEAVGPTLERGPALAEVDALAAEVALIRQDLAGLNR